MEKLTVACPSDLRPTHVIKKWLNGGSQLFKVSKHARTYFYFCVNGKIMLNNTYGLRHLFDAGTVTPLILEAQRKISWRLFQVKTYQNETDLDRAQKNLSRAKDRLQRILEVQQLLGEGV